MIDNFYQLGLSSLLEDDLSSYEYFYSLPANIQKRLELSDDIHTFSELQAKAEAIKDSDKSAVF